MKRILVVSCCALVVSLGVAGPAVASCVPLPPLEEAIAKSPVVFVGETTATSNEDRTATVEVSEIWKGEVPEGSVEVVGGAEGANTVSSVDRTYEVGITYLFVLYEPMKGGRFRDNSCSATAPYKERFDKLRPASAQVVSGDDRGTDDVQGVSFPPVPIILGGAALLAVAYLVGKRRSSG